MKKSKVLLTVLVMVGLFCESAAALTPIARYDVVPYQRISAGETFNLGVVAFSKEGIEGVEFAVSGQGYSGTNPLVSSEMSHNPRTDVYEYWVELSADEFSSDGVVEIEATVYGNDGGVRDVNTAEDDGLDTLILLVNPGGTLPEPTAWVDIDGDDNTGQVNNQDQPFATIGNAVYAIRQWMQENGYGDQIGGGIVELNPGTHAMNQGSNNWNTVYADEWFSIDGNGATITSGNSPQVRMFRVRDANLIRTFGRIINYNSNNIDQSTVWIENCNVRGDDKFDEFNNPVRGVKYYTESNFSNMGKAVSGALLGRNLYIHDIGDDAFCRTPLVLNSHAENIDPRDGICVGGGCNHADCWQWWGTPVPHNMIIYGLDCINNTYQGIFARTQGLEPYGVQNPPAEGVAIINLQTKLTDPKSFADNAWYIPANHMLFWHNSFDEEFNFWNDRDSSGKFPLNIVDFDVRGNSFFDVELNAPLGDDNGGDPQAPGVELDFWVSNHFLHEAGWEYFSETPGTDVTTGDPMVDSHGKPLAGSPLIDRVSPLVVPVDADNNLRNIGDVGAFEYIPGGIQVCTGTCMENQCDTYSNCTSLAETCTTGYCCSGSCTVTSSCSQVDSDSSGDVSISELQSYINQWKMGDITMSELMIGIGEWKNGC